MRVSRPKKRKSSKSKPKKGNGENLVAEYQHVKSIAPLPVLPRHVAIIMDGNGRWAQRKGLPRFRGHQEGAESVAAVVATARELQIEYLTLYAFSAENWGRPQLEVNALMHLLDEYLYKELDEMLEYGIRLHTIGDVEQLPKDVRKHLQGVIDATAAGRKMTLTLALSYGGRQELEQMVRGAVQAATDGSLKPKQVDEKYIREHLYTATMPDPDLLIRTAGEYRLSNFLLWQSAYTELYVTKTFWPDFRRAQFRRALENYAKRERRYGLTGEQVKPVKS